MSADVLKGVLRDTWYLVAALVAVIAVCTYQALRPQTAAVPEAPPVAAQDSVAAALPGTLQPSPARPDEKEQTRRTITDYQEQLAANPKAPEAPSWLNAMGNLSRQKLLDYKEAARYYELLLVDYPDWEGSHRVYPQLALCYEKLGDAKAEEWVYKRMMARFPEDSQEYLYAKTQLGM